MCCGKHINLPKEARILTTRELKEIKPKEVKNEKDKKEEKTKLSQKLSFYKL